MKSLNYIIMYEQAEKEKCMTYRLFFCMSYRLFFSLLFIKPGGESMFASCSGVCRAAWSFLSRGLRVPEAVTPSIVAFLPFFLFFFSF